MYSQQEHLPACPEYADQLVDLSDGELPADGRPAVEAHLATCAACRAQLRRLNDSLATLRTAIVAPSPRPSRFRPTGRGFALVAGGVAAAALALLVAVWALKAPTIGRGERPPTIASVDAAAPHDPGGHGTNGQATPTTGRGFDRERPISREAALRRIALLEQQARLEMSLALLPSGPAFADERAANQRLLAMFQQATADSNMNQ